MIATRTARIAALTAALALAAALTAATLLATGPRDGLTTGRGTAALTDRSPVLLRSAERGTAGVAPRTTPPPTLPGSAPAPGRMAAATTVEHS